MLLGPGLIPATRKAEIGRITVQGQPRQKENRATSSGKTVGKMVIVIPTLNKRGLRLRV
jgi:hypothetical protein